MTEATKHEAPSPVRETEELEETVSRMDERLTRMEETLDTTAKQVSFLPPQIRMMGGRIEGLSQSIGETKYRSLLLDLLSIHDLTDQFLRSRENGDPGESPSEGKALGIVRTQLGQILEANGLSRIPAEGSFDPGIHRAVERAPCEDPSLAGRIKEVVRPGFRTEQSILRYAEVVVFHHAPRPPDDPEPETRDSVPEDGAQERME